MGPTAATPYRRTLLYLAERLGEVPNTRLHKLVYLIDLEYYRRHGRTLTGAPWVRHNYGPMTKALLPALREMNGHELVERAKTTMSARTVKLVEPGPAPRFGADFDEEEREVADFILDLTRHLSDQQVLDLAYSTTPMRVILAREASLGRKLVDEPLDFEAPAVTTVQTEPEPETYAAFKRSEVRALGVVRARLLSDFAS